MLVTRSWICSRIVPENHLAPASAKARHKLQSRACITVIYPAHELTWAQEQRRKGQPAEITGWMRPSGDVTVPEATLLSEVKKNKALYCQSCTGSFRAGRITLLHVSLYLALHSDGCAGAIASFIPCLATLLGGECFKNDFR